MTKAYFLFMTFSAYTHVYQVIEEAEAGHEENVYT